MPELPPAWLTAFEDLMPRIQRLAEYAAKGKYDLAEDLYDEALERFPGIYDLWDGVRPLWPYVQANLRWYFYKYMRRPIHEELPELEVAYDQEASVEVLYLLDTLTLLDRKLVWYKYAEGFTERELAAWLGVSKTWVHERLKTCLLNLRKA